MFTVKQLLQGKDYEVVAVCSILQGEFLYEGSIKRMPWDLRKKIAVGCSRFNYGKGLEITIN